MERLVRAPLREPVREPCREPVREPWRDALRLAPLCRPELWPPRPRRLRDVRGVIMVPSSRSLPRELLRLAWLPREPRRLLRWCRWRVLRLLWPRLGARLERLVWRPERELWRLESSARALRGGTGGGSAPPSEAPSALFFLTMPRLRSKSRTRSAYCSIRSRLLNHSSSAAAAPFQCTRYWRRLPFKRWLMMYLLRRQCTPIVSGLVQRTVSKWWLGLFHSVCVLDSVICNICASSNCCWLQCRASSR